MRFGLCYHFRGPTGVLRETISNGDVEALSSRFELHQVALAPLKHHHPGSSTAPALLLHPELQPKRKTCVSVAVFEKVNQRMWVCRFFLPVIEGDWQFSLQHFLIALGQQAEELRLEGGLQEAVILGLVQDEKVILPRTAHNKYKRPLEKSSPALLRKHTF